MLLPASTPPFVIGFERSAIQPFRTLDDSRLDADGRATIIWRTTRMLEDLPHRA